MKATEMKEHLLFTLRRDDPGGQPLKFLFDIASAVENPADFHRLISDDIENREFVYLDTVIRILPLTG